MKILSLGAGVQSSTILMMSCFKEIEKIDAAIFADTRWETQETYEWLEFLKKEAKQANIPIHTISKGNIKEDAQRSTIRGSVKKGSRAASMPYFVKNAKGTEGKIRRQCTKEYKLEIIQKKSRELLGYKPRQRIPQGACEMWIGISLDEIKRCKYSKVRWVENYYPLIELGMSRINCREWFEKKGLPEPPRSSCVCCPHRNNEEWRRIRDTSPGEWEEVVEFDKSIRNTGGIRGQVFLHRSLKPLDEVDLSTLEEHGQINFMDDECAGLCAV